MDFGVVLQTDPPASRVVKLSQQAEQYGFNNIWAFDSHLLWQEPYVIFSRPCHRRADGHQPGDARLDRDRFVVRHPQRHVR
jgi:alkanesulfonate monooxygenase SsuD/methylene tetrahydromethanopterin reductase-like flavin-dependent oxidoreductase (luciferase family)